MIGMPEILILVVLLLLFGAPVVAAIVIWRYVIRPRRDGAKGQQPAK